MNGNLISKKEFGDRLYALRIKAGYRVPRELALVLCGHQKSKKGLIGEQAKVVARMRRNIENWELGKNIPHTPLVAALCNLLDCDPDHLLYTEATSPRKEVKNVSQATGLSESAVEVLQQLNYRSAESLSVKNIIETINLILIHADEQKPEYEVVPFLETLSAYLNCAPKDERIVSIETDGSVKIYADRALFEDEPGETVGGDYMRQIVRTRFEQRVMDEVRNLWNEKNGESRKAFIERIRNQTAKP